jgi:ORF6N domain
MLDFDLARVYDVETKSPNRAVKRNADRFPKDFMFQISSNESKNLKYQIGTSSSGHGGRRRRPYAFTEHGAFMAANVLRTGGTDERFRRASVSQNASLARRQARVGSKTCLAGNGTKKTTGCP